MENEKIEFIKHLLACVSEEAAEVSKEACKALRFGLHDVNPKTLITNFDAIKYELYDLIAVCEYLFDTNNGSLEEISINRGAIDGKKNKVLNLFYASRESIKTRWNND
jgi:hypothetical protein